jgi:protocatechuate 3,4-dioxygenase beta subunit
MTLTRRDFARTAAGLWVLGATGELFADCPPTPRNVAGPYWREGAPFRNRLWTNEPGEVITVAGRVRGADCRPIANAVLDIWQADSQGHYDSDLPGFDPKTYRLRGRVRADARGEYRFETIRPAPYGARPAHIHMVVSTPERKRLVTQLYFQGDPYLQSDPLQQVRDPLVVRFQSAPLTATMPAARKHSLGRFDITLS